MRRSSRSGKSSGSAIIETAVGLLILVPVVLALIDVAACVVVQTENEKLAKACARAAAEQTTYPLALGAANTIVAQNPRSQLMTTPTVIIPGGAWDGQTVTCQTNLTCNLPVPLPLVGTSSVPFQATSTEPVVSNLPP